MRTARTAALGLALLLSGAAPLAAQDTPQPERNQETQAERIERLIAQMGSDSYEEREAAQRELEAIGAPAIPALQKATQNEDLEIASRASDALAKLQGRRPEPTRERDREVVPQDDPRMPPMPPPLDMDEVFKDLEKQLPEGFGKILRRMFQDGLPGQPERQGEDAQPQDEERQGDLRPRVRTWTWNLNPGQSQTDAVGAQLGLNTGPPSAALRAQLELEGGEGRVVNQLVPGSFAAAHGIQLYDVLLNVDGRPVKRTLDLNPLLDKACKVQLFRKAKLVTLSLPRATAPEAEPEAPAEGESPGKQRSF